MKTLYVFLSVIVALVLAGCVTLQAKVALFGEKTMFVKSMEDCFRNNCGNNPKAKEIAWGTWVIKTQPDGKKKFGSWFAFYAETMPTIGDHVLIIVNQNEIKISEDEIEKYGSCDFYVTPFREIENAEGHIRWNYSGIWDGGGGSEINLIHIWAKPKRAGFITLNQAPSRVSEAVQTLKDLGIVEQVKIHFYN